MRISLCIFVLFSILLFSTACNTQSPSPTETPDVSSTSPQDTTASNTSQGEDKVSDTPQESPLTAGTSSAEAAEIFQTQSTVLGRINNNVTYETLITKEFDIDSFIQKYSRNPYVTIPNPPNIKQIEEDYGIECIRKTDADTLYSVHKVKRGGLFYIFYRTRQENGKEYEEVHNWFYVKNNLKYKNFASIKEGSTIEAVEAIDPITTLYKNRINSYDNWEKKPMSHSLHYLKDGILTIFYMYRDDKYVVVMQQFEKNYQVNIYGYPTSPAYDGYILSKDFIK